MHVVLGCSWAPGRLQAFAQALLISDAAKLAVHLVLAASCSAAAECRPDLQATFCSISFAMPYCSCRDLDSPCRICSVQVAAELLLGGCLQLIRGGCLQLTRGSRP